LSQAAGADGSVDGASGLNQSARLKKINDADDDVDEGIDMGFEDERPSYGPTRLPASPGWNFDGLDNGGDSPLLGHDDHDDAASDVVQMGSDNEDDGVGYSTRNSTPGPVGDFSPDPAGDDEGAEFYQS